MSARENLFENSFPQTIEDELDTVQFLNASRGTVWLIERFGDSFFLVKRDLFQNIEKLHNRYNEDPITYKCLKRMILEEKNRGENYIIDSLLWLRRSLTMMKEFLILFVENERKNIVRNINEYLKIAYDRTLRHHHSFFISIAFKALMEMAPERSCFLETLGVQEKSDHAQILVLLDDYSKDLANVLTDLENLYISHNIKPHS